MSDRADDELAEQAAAVLRGMAEHGIRIDDRAFERFTTTLLAEYDRRGAEIQRVRAAQCNALRSDIEHERDQLRQQRRAALALIDSAEREGLNVIPEADDALWYLLIQPLRAALGAADEPTTGGAE